MADEGFSSYQTMLKDNKWNNKNVIAFNNTASFTSMYRTGSNAKKLHLSPFEVNVAFNKGGTIDYGLYGYGKKSNVAQFIGRPQAGSPG